MPGPRFYAAGGSITITGGHGWQFGYEADGIPEMIKLTRALARDGADHYKIVSWEAAQITSKVAGVEELTVEEVTAIVREARRLGRRVMCHAQSRRRGRQFGGGRRQRGACVPRRSGRARDAQGMRDDAGPDPHGHGRLEHIPGVSQAIRDNQARLSIVHRQSCETAIALGIPLATGTDCGVRGVMADMVWREIWNLFDHGLSPMDAIKAGTSGGARLIGVEDSAGRSRPGGEADLLLVHGNPLTDLRRLENPALVMLGGKVVHRGVVPSSRVARAAARPRSTGS